MNHLLLLGAGFSRNWGGWLADEALEYLLGARRINVPLRQLLIKHKRQGGFEAALAELLEERSPAGRREPELLVRFQEAVSQMFADMDTAFAAVPFEWSNQIKQQVAPFLTRFDAIFTLNQDLLLERHYHNDNVSLMSNGKWSGWSIPGMQRQGSDSPPLTNPNLDMMVPLSDSDFEVAVNSQPYFKLHGSSNWFASATDNVMVIGGNKQPSIDRYRILKFYSQQFHEYLNRPNTRLMVIGYGFGDNHINNMIVNAANVGGLSIFLIDPMGIDVVDKNQNATIYHPDAMAEALWPKIIGASRRPLSATFSIDVVEHNKVMQFFV